MNEPQITKEQLDEWEKFGIPLNRMKETIALARRLRETIAAWQYAAVMNKDDGGYRIGKLLSGTPPSEILSPLTAELEQANERIKMLLAELDSLRKDKERLDWDFKNPNRCRYSESHSCWILDENKEFKSRRTAIDSAMRKESK